MKTGHLGIIDGKRTAPKTNTFSLAYDSEQLKLLSPAKIEVGNKTILTDKAVWDTGANITMVSEKVTGKLSGDPVEEADTHGIGGTDKTRIYMGNVEFPGGIIFDDVTIWIQDLRDLDFEVIIGMDVISRGRLVVEERKGIPTFSFSAY